MFFPASSNATTLARRKAFTLNGNSNLLASWTKVLFASAGKGRGCPGRVAGAAAAAVARQKAISKIEAPLITRPPSDGSNRPGGLPLLGFQDADHLFIQRGVGRDAIGSPDRVLAGPGCVMSAGFADDRRDGGAVPRVHLRI